MSDDHRVATKSRRHVSAQQSARLSALNKLKQLKGSKNKYDIQEEDNVYDEVNEEEYSEIVAQRQRDSWIVDDYDNGYADDGREIFDDQLDDDDPGDYAPSKYVNEKKKIPLNRKDNATKKKSDIRSMFMAADTKKNTKKSLDDVKLNDHELDDILQYSTSSSVYPSNSTPKPLKLNKRIIKTDLSSPQSNPFAVRENFENGSTRKSVKRIGDSVDYRPPLKKRMNGNNKTLELNYDEIFNEFIDDKMNCEDIKEEIAIIDKKCETTEKFNESLEWNALNSNDIQSVPIASVLPKELTFETDKENNKYIQFYWYDAHNDYFKHPGIVYLFGKVWIKEQKRHVSSCIIVKNIERRVYLLPRLTDKTNPKKNITIQDVYNEFSDDISKKFKITQFRSRKVTKNYSFDKHNVPREAEYLEILYPANFQALPNDLSGNTFSAIFGTNTSPLEMLLLDCKMKGPNWLKIKNAEISDPPISWCKIELIVNKANSQIVVETGQMASPNFTLVSLNLRTFLNPNNKLNEIVGISCLVNRSFSFEPSSSAAKYDSHFCAITKPSNNCNVILPYDFNQNMALKSYKKTKVEVMGSERELLSFFMAKFHQIDADIIVGHDIYEFDYDLLLSRLCHYKNMSWSKLGRLKRSGLPLNRREKMSLCGRLVCDIKISSKELIRAKSYDLTELAAQIIRKSRYEIEQPQMVNFYSSSNQLIRLIDLMMKDNELILSIMFELNALPLALQITNIAGNLLSRTLLCGRSERNEYLLLHAFNQKNFICPDKIYLKNRENVNEENNDGTVSGKSKGQNSKRKAAYTGGLVLEPKVGFYDRYILLMDFNSLYPSIIQEYNICFTTISQNISKDAENDSEEYIPEVPSAALESGILPTEIRKLVESRREAKKLMCTPGISSEAKQQYDIRQKALKLTANSMYGCLGFSNSRFYAKPLAALVTAKGREILLHTKQLVEKLGLEVIYGDTDSIMILTNCTSYDEVKSIGSKVQAEVNRLYKLLEIDIDGVFRSMLLLKKKKYAALTVQRSANGEISYAEEIKGLDIVRRDWSIIAKNAGQRVLKEILSIDKTSDAIIDDIHNYLKELTSSIMSNQIPKEEFVINKALTKNPEDYNDKKSLSHVTVALRYNSLNKGKKLRNGDTVPYIICEDISQSNTNIPATQRAYHPEELKDNENLIIDFKYYLSQQIHPVVSRLCEPIEGTDSHILAEFLGIESSVRTVNHSVIETEALYERGEHKYDNCKSLIFTCLNEHCKKEIEIRSIIKLNSEDKSKQKFELIFSKCSHCGYGHELFMAPKFEVQLRQYINKFINQFYQKWMMCEDPMCSFRTRNFTGQMTKCGPKCPECKQSVLYPDINEAQLNHQLMYFKYLLDLDGAKKEYKLNEKEIISYYKPLYDKLKAIVQRYLDLSSYNEVDLDYLFKKFRPKNKK